MSVNVGLPKYDDILNNKNLEKLKLTIQKINSAYKQIANDEAVMNRGDELYEKYMPQYFSDMNALHIIRNCASELSDICDKTSFIIATRSLEQRLDEIRDDKLIQAKFGDQI